MNIVRPLFFDNTRTKPRVNSVAYLITQGLGYCCEWFFWRWYAETNSDLIAARLGCAARTINRHRQAYDEAEFSCAHCTGCLKSKLSSRYGDSVVLSGEMK